VAERRGNAREILTRPLGVAVVAGVPVDNVTMSQTMELIEAFTDEGRATGRSFQIATVNVDFVVNAQHDPDLFRILQAADLCLPDGMPILWHALLMGTRLTERVAGADLVPLIVDRSRAAGWRVLLFGSAAGVAESAAELLGTRFPGAVVKGMSGQYMSDVRHMDPSEVDQIVSFAPDVICVALGNPKQEKWIEAYRSVLGASVLIGVGGTLDFLVGEQRRAPMWMRRWGLEWLFRAIQEPSRLGRRYIRDGTVFGPILARAALNRLRSPVRSSWARRGEARRALVVEADHRVDVSGRTIDTCDVAQLVDLARAAQRDGQRLELTGCSTRTVEYLQSASIVKMFDIAHNPSAQGV
jgi:exopolysaccharide biosynthesis WecB/TagA/CpsF family protein